MIGRNGACWCRSGAIRAALIMTLTPLTLEPAPYIIGPFATRAEAHNWSLSYPGSVLVQMASPEYELIWHREQAEDGAASKPRN